MRSHLRTRGSMILLTGLLVLLTAGSVDARWNPAYPPNVSNPTGTVNGCKRNCRCTNTCPCTGPNCGQPPGGGNSMPEPATLVSGLIGASLAGLYGWRRKKVVVVE